MKGIVFDESIPLAITIAPSECTSLCKILFDEMNGISPESIDWNQMFAISDMHVSIKSACKIFGNKQYFCHRHLLEHFGSSCFLAFFANKLLKCFSVEEYLTVAEEISKKIDEYVIERSKMGPISEDLSLKIAELKIMSSFEDGDSESYLYYKNWALWGRRLEHVSRCSNHKEAFHRKLNIYIDVIINQLDIPSFDILSFCKYNCKCQEDLYNALIYGTSILCRHHLNYFICLQKQKLNLLKINLI